MFAMADSYEISGGKFGLELWSLLVEQSRRFHHEHSRNISFSCERFILEDLCSSLHQSSQLVKNLQHEDQSSFCSASLSTLLSAYKTEFGQTIEVEKTALDALNFYRTMRFGGRETGTLSGSFQWESPLRVLGSPYPNPGTLLLYKMHQGRSLNSITEILPRYMEAISEDYW
jgi:hypothetical protein